MITNQNLIYKTSDDISLYLTRNIVEDAKAIVLIVHGLAEHSGRYDYVVDKLNSFKYSVYRFDNRGHGKSEGKRGYIEDYNEYKSDLEEVIDFVKKENNNLPIFVLGHSMGGMITALYSIKNSKKVNGVILSAALTYDNKGLMEAGKDLDKNEVVKNELSAAICKDESVVNNYNNDELVLKEITGSIFVECSKAVQYIKENANNINLPILLLHGGEDSIVYNQDSRDLFFNIGSKYKKIKVYNDMYHEILNEFEKDIVLEDINNWIRKELRYI